MTRMRLARSLVLAGLVAALALGCQSRRLAESIVLDAAVADAGPVTTAAFNDAGPWPQNPFESTPVTHLAERSFTPGTSGLTANETLFSQHAGAMVVGGQPYLLDCQVVTPFGPDFALQAPLPIDAKLKGLCGPIVATAGSRFYLLSSVGNTAYERTVAAVDVPTHTQTWARTLPGRESLDAESIRVAGGVPVLLDAGEVVALNATTGAVAWTRPATPREMAIGLAADEAHVFALDRGGTVHALAPATGSLRWTARVEELASGDAGAHPGAIALAAGAGTVALAREGQLVLLDAATGARRASVAIPGFDLAGGATRISVFAGPGGVAEVYAYANHALVRLDPNTGALVWSQPGYVHAVARGRDALFTDRAAAVAYDDVPDGVAHALDPATGRELWSYAGSHFLRSGHLDVAVLDVGGTELLTTFAHQGNRLHVFERGRDELTPHDRTVDVVLRPANAVPHPEQLHFLVGSQPMQLDAGGHWRGQVHGRGTVWVRELSGTSGLGEVSIDLESAAPTASVVLGIHDSGLHQACAGP
jgi:outer membrane protein assembly factor BamB